MRWLRRVVPAALLLFACGEPAPAPKSDSASEQQRVEALSAHIVRMGRLDLPGADCGSPAVEGRNVVVFATADMCLSCLEVGALLRDLTRRGVPVPDRAVVTPAAHTREVCDYLRRQKVRWRVVGIAEEDLPATHAPRGIVYFELEPDGRIRRRERAATPLALAAIVLPESGVASPAQPSTGDTP